MIPGRIPLRRPRHRAERRPAAARRSPVNNTGDRPVQVGSHFHFFEVNRALVFDRAKAYGMRLDLPAGTAVRFEPGEIKEVRLSRWPASASSTASTAWSMARSTIPPVGRRSLERMRQPVSATPRAERSRRPP